MADFGVSEALLALCALSTVGSVVSGVSSANANASNARAEAKSIDQQKQIEQTAERQNNAKVISKQVALAAASGVDTTTGTPLDNQLDAARIGEMNAQQIGYSGELKRQAAK